MSRWFPRVGCVLALSTCFACAARVSPPVEAASNAQAATPSPSEQSLVLETSVPALPRPVTSFGAAAHGGGVFLYGGYFGEPHAYSREGQSGELLRIDLASGQVSSLADGPGVQGAQLVASPEGLIRVGGMVAENAHGEREQIRSLADVARFSESTRTWESLPALPAGRSSHAIVLHGRTLFVFGGWTLSGERSKGEFVSTTLALNLDTNAWTSIEQPFRARALAAGVVGDKIVIVGGLDEGAQVLRAVHVFDPQTGAWARGTDYPEDAFGIAAVSNGRALFASARDGVLYRLDDPAGTWQAVTPLAFPRFFHQLVMSDASHVVALGGISGMHRGDRVAHVEAIDLEAKGPRVVRWKLRNPSHAKNRQGIQIVDDTLFVFGGNRSLGQHDFEPQDFLDEAYALNLASLKASPLPAFPVPRQTVQTTSVDGRLLALGGFGHDGEKARAHADSYLFDVQRGNWLSYSSTLPTPRTQFGLVERQKELWIFGGLDYDPSRAADKQFVHPVEVLHAKDGEPLQVSDVSLPRPRRAFGGALLGDRYYLVGGMADGFAPVDTCDVFDFAARAWSSIKCPESRISAQLVALGGKLYLAGGSTPGAGPEPTPNARLEVYDPATDTWSTVLDTIPVEPRHLSMRVYRHALVLYSAHQPEETAELVLIVPTP